MHIGYHLFNKHPGLFSHMSKFGTRIYYSSFDSSYKLMLDKASVIFDYAVKSVMPQSMVTNALKVDGQKLEVREREYFLNKNVHILAFGKAVIGMVRATEDKLGDHVCGGVASVPHGIVKHFRHMEKWDLLPSPLSRVQLYEGAKNNLPDESAHQAALQIYKYAQSLTATDICLVLISGGGSALLPTPVPPVTISDLNHVTKLLASQGATIQDINSVRKQIEILKGGGLAEVASPAQVVSLVLSDVIGDPLSFIASGPTLPDDTSPLKCLELFTKLGVTYEVPKTVYQVLESGKKSLIHHGTDISHLPPDKTEFKNIQNVIIGSNTIACRNAQEIACHLDYIPYTLSTSLCGQSHICGKMLADLAQHLCEMYLDQSSLSSSLQQGLNQALDALAIDELAVCDLKDLVKESLTTKKGICVILAGETTVNVKGKGQGGRNQEMAMYWAGRMDGIFRNNPDLGEKFRLAFLSAGTDGQDGPCEAAGAMVTPGMVREGQGQGLKVDAYLENNDSYQYFSRLSGGKYHVGTGLTGTNVMDIQLLLIEAVRE